MNKPEASHSHNADAGRGLSEGLGVATKRKERTMEDKRAKVLVTVKTTRTLLLPTLPNFLRTPADEAVDVGDLTEDQIREVGAKWIDALVRKSRDRRGESIARLNREIAKR
jgi:hypothetical protein